MPIQLASYVFGASQLDSIIVIHGLFGEADNWRSLAKQWARSMQVITVDLRNHGHSPHVASMSYTDMAEDVLHLMDEQGIESAHVLGHSMGGKVAMQMSILAPERVQSLVVADIAPVAYVPRHQQVFAGLFAVDLETLASRKQALQIMREHINDAKVCQFLLKSLYVNDTGRFGWRFHLACIKDQYVQISAGLQQSVEPNTEQPVVQAGRAYDGPVLVIKGALSEYVLAQHKAAFEALFSHVSVRIMQDVGHWLHAENPNLFSRIVMRFVESHVESRSN